MNHNPAYYLNEVLSAKVEVHTTHGMHPYTATLIEFFGRFSIVLTSYSQADHIDLKVTCWADAEEQFNRFVQLHPGKAVA